MRVMLFSYYSMLKAVVPERWLDDGDKGKES